MILQSSGLLDKDVNENGCYFMSILFCASQRGGVSFGAPDILEMKRKAVEGGCMRGNCYVLDPDGVFALAGLGTVYTGKHEGPSRVALSDELEILYYRYGSFGHFVAGVGGLVAYDPLGRSNAVGKGSLQSKRIFVVR